MWLSPEDFRSHNHTYHSSFSHLTKHAVKKCDKIDFLLRETTKKPSNQSENDVMKLKGMHKIENVKTISVQLKNKINLSC